MLFWVIPGTEHANWLMGLGEKALDFFFQNRPTGPPIHEHAHTLAITILSNNTMSVKVSPRGVVGTCLVGVCNLML